MSIDRLSLILRSCHNCIIYKNIQKWIVVHQNALDISWTTLVNWTTLVSWTNLVPLGLPVLWIPQPPRLQQPL